MITILTYVYIHVYIYIPDIPALGPKVLCYYLNEEFQVYIYICAAYLWALSSLVLVFGAQGHGLLSLSAKTGETLKAGFSLYSAMCVVL